MECTYQAVYRYFFKCGEWIYLFATNVANVKLLLDIAALKGGYNKVAWKEHIIKVTTE